MLAPSFATLLDLELNSVVLIEHSEEESQQKTSNDLQEKDVIVYRPSIAATAVLPESILQNLFYQEYSSKFYIRILIPPPESTS